MSTEVEKAETTDTIAPYKGEDWSTLVGQSTEVFGADLEKGDALVGVPFCVIRATIRTGDYPYPRGGPYEGLMRPYASLDVIVGPDEEIAKGVRRGRILNLSVDAGEHLVVNEAGTGAYRQLCQCLEAWGMVTFPEGRIEGPLDESKYDLPIREWGFPQGNVRISATGDLSAEFDIRLLCPRGFRASDYENEYTKAGRTRYFG